MTVTDRRPALAALAGRILAEETLGEDFGYDIAPAFVPQPGGMVAGYLLVVSCRSPLLSPPRMAAPCFIPDGWPDDAQIRVAVRECLKNLTELRKQLLALPAATNGGGQ